MLLYFSVLVTPEIYTLSLHDALPISGVEVDWTGRVRTNVWDYRWDNPVAVETTSRKTTNNPTHRSEEHTSELQSRGHLVCRLLLEKKNENARPYVIDLNNEMTASTYL